MSQEKVYKPTELQAFLKENGLHAKKGLSQNFLIDGNIIQKIVTTADVSKNDLIIEIGPGPGALTQALLERGAHVVAIEMDPLFADQLQRLQTEDNRLTIIQQDVLKFPLIEFLKDKRCKVVANLPYHITTPILTLLLPHFEKIESLTIMVQKEFADRMHGKKGTPEYSSFTVFLEFYATVIKTFTVSPNCFYPRPKVQSSVVHCKLHPPLLEKKEEEGFFRLTRTAFGQRRKMLRASLKEIYTSEKVEAALIKLGYSPTERPEQLALQEFISLFETLKSV
jgi:16S rRNA (adenine1518-N6/adenine1519-N6)-dimethyltransferase